MNINATLIGQLITFLIFVGITMKWIWPLFKNVLDERAKKIADGLAAGEQGHRELEVAEKKRRTILADAKEKAASILDEANLRAHHIIEEAKQQARVEGERLIEIANADIEQQVTSAREKLRKQLANLAVTGAERILQHSIDEKAANQMLDDLITELK
jgi:F-type H+-transporting ATPase subunit b